MDGQATMCSVCTLSIGNNLSMGYVEYGKVYVSYLPPGTRAAAMDRHATSWILACAPSLWTIGGLVVDAIIKPKPGCSQRPSAMRATPSGREEISQEQ
jgi:hypothetical protein